MLNLILPQSMSVPIPPSPADEDSVQAVADLISRHRFGCPALCLPVEKREQLLADTEWLLSRLDAVGGPYAS